jgi:hypothetical protein
MVIGTALGFSEWGTVALAVGLAFLFGYSLTSLPPLRAGIAFTAVIPIALAADSVSIAIMEIIDNAAMLLALARWRPGSPIRCSGARCSAASLSPSRSPSPSTAR